jgi:hypothetical protein
MKKNKEKPKRVYVKKRSLTPKSLKKKLEEDKIVHNKKMKEICEKKKQEENLKNFNTYETIMKLIIQDKKMPNDTNFVIQDGIITKTIKKFKIMLFDALAKAIN